MSPQDLEAFAEDIFHRFGPKGTVEALKRANLCLAIGDKRNADIWLAIKDRVREMQRPGSGERSSLLSAD